MTRVVKVEGLREVEAALMELKTSTAKSVGRRVLKRAAQLFVDRANALAPKDVGSRDYPLKGSYRAGTFLTRAAYRQERREGRSEVFMYGGTAHPNGTWQEFGTVDHGPNPHARPAWDATQDQMLDLISRDLAVEVGKAVARARRKAARQG